MRARLITALVTAGLILSSAPALAGGGPNLKGSGWAQNDNSGGPSQQSKLGFAVKATGPGIVQGHDIFPVDITVYPASGAFVFKNVLTSDPSVIVNEGKGKAVCIADLGPSSGVDGGGNPAADVWEIRVGFVDPDSGVTVYGSFFVQDDGTSDWEDESFEAALLLDPSCGLASQYRLEPFVEGKLVVQG